MSRIGRVVMMHAAWESRHPDIAEMEEIYETTRRNQHERMHGSLDTFRPRREFPCTGALRAVEEWGERTPKTVLACDSCPYQITVPSADVQGAPF